MKVGMSRLSTSWRRLGWQRMAQNWERNPMECAGLAALWSFATCRDRP